MKRILLTTAIFAMMAIPALHHTTAAPPDNCGPKAYGHTNAGNLPTVTCDRDDLPAFGGTDHIQASSGLCPIDGLPVFYGHTMTGN